MDESKVAEKQPDVCTMRIAFPVLSDDEAIEIKKKISAILAGIKNVQVTFSIMTIPQSVPPTS